MKSSTHIAIALAALVLSQVAFAADPDDEALKKFDQNLDVAKAFEPGQNNGPLMEIERLVFYLPRDSKVRETIEQKLIVALQAAATNDAQDFFCRQLQVIATVKSIPCLEQLLTDAEASPMAVYALGYLEFPEACQALHRALGKTTGTTQAGIINALANRQYQEAKPDLVKLLSSTDAVVAQAAARAVGKLSGADAAEALQAVRAGATPELALTIDKALLECAAGLAAAGSHDQAAAIYDSIRSQQKLPQFQLAALRGLVMTRQAEAANLLVQAIQQDNGALAGEAIAMINMVPGAEATRAFMGLLKPLPPADQVVLLRALGSRGDTTAAAALVEFAGSADGSVRLAALEALGSAGDAAAVVTLVEAATAGGEVKRVAQRSLLHLPSADADQRLFELIDTGTEQVRIAAIDAISGRGVATAVQPLLKTALDQQPAVRQAAMRALGSLATPSDLRAMLKLVVESKSAEDRPVLAAAVAKLLPRCEDKDQSVALILDALERASAASQPALLQILGYTGSEQALPALRSHLQDSSSDNQNAVISAFSQWPDARVLDDLLGVIETARGPAQMELALKGYIRLASTSAEPTELFSRVLKHVAQVSDKKQVLTVLGTQADSPGAMEMALTFLNDKELGPTAGLAAVHIAQRLRDAQKELARKTFERVITEVNHDDVQQRAQEALNEMDRFEGHLLNWMVVGPFVEQGQDGEAVYGMVFDPEEPDAKDVKWVLLDKGIGSWAINLEAMLGSHDHCAAYLRTRVWCPQEQDAALEMGCDDAVKAWLNGKLVYNNWTVNSAAPRQHRAEVHLQQGWNDLLLKAVDFEGGWVVACRVRARNGIAIDGLKVEAK